MKYFLMGAFATGFLVYGMALVYGATGTRARRASPRRLGTAKNPGLVFAGGFMLVVAFGFKVAAVPFHMWAPDAYEGAPTPVTGFMAAGVKAAAFAAIIRVFGTALGGDVVPVGALGWASPMAVLAALTMTLGNLARGPPGQHQAHARVLVDLARRRAARRDLRARPRRAERERRPGLLPHRLHRHDAGRVRVVAFVGSQGRERLLVDDWAGLGAQHPAVALAMTIFLLSLGGVPPTGGFFGKFYLFKAAMEVADGQLLWLVVLGVLNTAISIYYYLRIVTAMYFRDANQPFVADALGRAHVRDRGMPAAGARDRHHAGLVAAPDQLSVAAYDCTARAGGGSWARRRATGAGAASR